MSAWAVGHNEAMCEQLVAVIDAQLGYPNAAARTLTHAEVREHPAGGEFAVSLDRLDINAPWLVTALFEFDVVTRLPDDWAPAGYP
jgi:hypothetical protein